MKKVTTFICFLAMLVNADAQKTNSFSLGFGKATYTTFHTPYSEKLIFDNGSATRTRSEIRGMKGFDMTLGYERQLFHRFSAGLNLTGSRIKSAGINEFNDADFNSNPIVAAFPYDRKLWAGLGYAHLLFDFLKSDDMELKLGVGPSAVWSKFDYASFTTLYLLDSGQTSFVEKAVTSKRSVGLGYAYSFSFGVALPNSLFLQFQVQNHRIETNRFTTVNIGMGIKLFGNKIMP